ncbi:MAG: DUF1700 domain-containing protein [Clostridiales bacterium]|nr:DUF1700 domain-containing protein [Clostridiales bacterium]
MNKETYLQELRKGLKILPQYDRDEAVEFYEEYFDEAGIENEAKVIEELGEPKILAKKILVDVVDRKYEETMAATKEDYSSQNAMAVVPAPTASGFDPNAAAGATATAGAAYGAQAETLPPVQPQAQKEEKKNDQPSALKTLLIVLAAIFALPLSPVIFALLIVVSVLVFVAFVVLISFLIAGIAMFAAAIGTLVFGLIALFINPIAGMCVLGSGLTVFGLGIFFIIGSIALIRITAHGLAKGLGRIVHKRNRKNKAAQAGA